MRTYEEIVLNAAEIAIEENGGRINCFEIEDFKAFTKTLEGAGYFWEMDASTDWVIIEKATGQEDIMSRYYYMIGHDSNEIRFEEFDGIQELADMHYDGDTRRALADDEYVFDQDEYDAWITEEI